MPSHVQYVYLGTGSAEAERSETHPAHVDRELTRAGHTKAALLGPIGSTWSWSAVQMHGALGVHVPRHHHFTRQVFIGTFSSDSLLETFELDS